MFESWSFFKGPVNKIYIFKIETLLIGPFQKKTKTLELYKTLLIHTLLVFFHTLSKKSF